MVRVESLRHLAVGIALACAAGTMLFHASAATVPIAIAIAATAVLLFVRQAARHRRLTRGLVAITRPGKLNGIEVRLGPIHHAAFVAGLLAPRIFCDARLATELTDNELRAVTLHEQAHQVARDPLRMTLMAVIAPPARLIPSGAAWLERRAAEREIAADRTALSRGASRAAIASALLKVGRLEPAGAAGFAPAVDLRLRALLGDETFSPRPRRWGAAVAGLALGTALCLLLLQWSAGNAAGLTCC